MEEDVQVSTGSAHPGRETDLFMHSLDFLWHWAVPEKSFFYYAAGWCKLDSGRETDPFMHSLDFLWHWAVSEKSFSYSAAGWCKSDQVEEDIQVSTGSAHPGRVSKHWGKALGDAPYTSSKRLSIWWLSKHWEKALGNAPYTSHGISFLYLGPQRIQGPQTTHVFMTPKHIDL